MGQGQLPSAPETRRWRPVGARHSRRQQWLRGPRDIVAKFGWDPVRIKFPTAVRAETLNAVYNALLGPPQINSGSSGGLGTSFAREEVGTLKAPFCRLVGNLGVDCQQRCAEEAGADDEHRPRANLASRHWGTSFTGLAWFSWC